MAALKKKLNVSNVTSVDTFPTNAQILRKLNNISTRRDAAGELG